VIREGTSGILSEGTGVFDPSLEEVFIGIVETVETVAPIFEVLFSFTSVRAIAATSASRSASFSISFSSFGKFTF
jgi:hypothetical protein